MPRKGNLHRFLVYYLPALNHLNHFLVFFSHVFAMCVLQQCKRVPVQPKTVRNPIQKHGASSVTMVRAANSCIRFRITSNSFETSAVVIEPLRRNAVINNSNPNLSTA